MKVTDRLLPIRRRAPSFASLSGNFRACNYAKLRSSESEIEERGARGIYISISLLMMPVRSLLQLIASYSHPGIPGSVSQAGRQADRINLSSIDRSIG